MNLLGMVTLVCSQPGCGVVYAPYKATLDEIEFPLCPRCQKARLVQTETPGCSDDPDVWNYSRDTRD